MNNILWRCNFCDGPAWWCFINEKPHYSCKRQCGGFMQNPLDFMEETIYSGCDRSASDARHDTVPYLERNDEGGLDRVPF